MNAAAKPDRQPLLILAADDDPVNRKLLTALGARCGWRVVCAEDGSEALALWREGRFDLVLLDMEMPGCSGLEVARLIRSAEAGSGGGRVPVLAMTAHPRGEVLEGCLAAGMDDCLSKPFHFSELVALCRKTIDRSRGKGYKQ